MTTDVERSTKDLWVLISGSSELRSKELVGTELVENCSRILLGTDYYKIPSSASHAKLCKDLTDKDQLAFVGKLSKLLKIDEIQCYNLLCTYQVYEYKGTSENLKQCFTNERNSQILLSELWNFYYGERLYGLLCLKHILCHWQDDSHPYQDIYKGFLDKLNDNEGIVGKTTIAQLEHVSSADVPTRETFGSHYSDVLLQRWVTYNLKEQLELLQILIVYFKDAVTTIEEIHKLLCLFQKHSFGHRLGYHQQINDAVQHLVEALGFLEGILLVECFELEWLQKCCEEKSNDHFLLKQHTQLQTVDRAICCLGTHREHSTLLLSWMLYHYLSISKNSTEQESLYVQMGRNALKLDVFDYLKGGLSLAVLSGDGIIPTLLSTVVYNLLCVLLSTFEINALGKSEQLYQVGEKVLRYPNIASDFWEKGLNEGMGYLLSEALALFPTDFKLLKILDSLSRAGPNSCNKVFALLERLPSYSESLIDDSGSIALHDKWQLIQDKFPYPSDSIVLPKGTFGELMPIRDTASPIVRWNQPVNGWKICHLELLAQYRIISYGAGHITPEVIEQILDIATIMNNTIRFCPNSVTNMEELFQVLLAILNKFFMLSSPPTALVAACVNVIEAIGCKKPAIAWGLLNDTNFLPFATGNADSIAQLANGVNCNVGVVGQQLVLQEQVAGRYNLLLSFLELMNTVTEEISKNDDQSYLACLVFLLKDVLPNYHNWRYVELGNREQIGRVCLNVVHKLLMVSDYTDKNRLSKCQQLCIHCLLFTDASQGLLRMVMTGENVIRNAMEQPGSQLTGLGQKLTELVRQSLSVLNRLLLFRNTYNKESQNGSSQLEQSLISTPSQPNRMHIILGVVYYSFQRYDPKMATLAVQLLRRFAQEYPMSLSACFGSEARAVRDLFLARLKSPTEDLVLKVAIVRFLTACVSKQPGLLEMFVNVQANELGETETNDKNKQENCLSMAISILKENKKDPNSQKQLHCSVVEFIHSLWAATHLLAIEQLKMAKDIDFWSLFCEPLLSNTLNNVHDRVTAFILHTLALQGFQCSIFGKSQSDSGNTAVLKQIEDRKLILLWSKHVNEFVPLSSDLSRKQLDCSLTSNDVNDSFLLFLTWRDFLFIVAKQKLINFSDVEKRDVLRNICSTLIARVSTNSSHQLLNLLSEMYLMLFQEWNESLNDWSNWTSEFGEYLDVVASCSDNLNSRMLSSVIASAILGLRIAYGQKNFELNSITNWLTSSFTLAQNSIQLAYRALVENNRENIELSMMSLHLLKDVISLQLDRTDSYMPLLGKYSLLPVLIDLFVGCLQNFKGVQLAHSILTLFITLSSVNRVSDMLSIAGFLPNTTLLLASTYQKNIENHHWAKQDRNSIEWEDIFCLSVQLASSLLSQLKHFGLNDSLNFIGVHLNQLAVILQRVRVMPHTKAVNVATHVCNFVQILATHQKQWRLEHPISYELLISSVTECCAASAAYLLRPSLLEHLLEHHKSVAVPPNIVLENPEAATPVKTYPGDVENQEKYTPEFISAQSRLLELLAASLTTLQKFSPKLEEILSDQGLDVKDWEILLYPGFTSATIEQNQLSFGTILSSLSVCVLAKSRPAYENLFGHQKFLFSYVLETGLVFLLSQAVLYQLTPAFNQRERQLLRRELNAELSSLVLSLSRSMRKGTAPPFLKFLLQVVDKLLK